MLKKMTSPLLSLCIPTNGIIELIFPVLASIYSQTEVDLSLYEVVVMDNGDNPEFKAKIKEFAGLHKNLVYRETDKKGFLSESECYKVASGEFIKFINHRTKLLPNTISYFMEFIKKNEGEKPCVYFANGVVPKIKGSQEYSDFDSYVRNLHIWSSWSTGMGFWKEDFDRIPKVTEFNELFPHTTILFNERNKSKYIIDNNVLLDEIHISHANKGKYNLFYAFAVEYPAIICDLLRDGSISTSTFLSVKKDAFKFIKGLYLDFVILKHKCSYDLAGRKKSVNVFFNYGKLRRSAFFFFLVKALKYPISKGSQCMKKLCSRLSVGGGYSSIVKLSSFCETSCFAKCA